MSSEDRKRVQAAFTKDEVQIVVATVAFGMGIDKPNVRFVVHYDMPKNVESYYQETGRAGRDGLPSDALMLYGAGDLMMVRRLIKGGENPQQVKIELSKLDSMVAIAEAYTCRRQLLLAYFGETLGTNCGNCDTCLDDPDLYDATEDVKLALMAIYRTGQKFGIGYIGEILMGKSSQRSESLGHDKLEEFGKGANQPKEAWDSVLLQLMNLGYIRADEENYNVLKLLPPSRDILREGKTLMLHRPRQKPVKTRRAKKDKAIGQADRKVFERLRAWRREAAAQEGIAPFMVFGDTTLIQLSLKQPRSREDLLQVSGIGEHKADKYGDEVLKVLNG
jgi:ATP-dependent DNA helicase RecQ